MPETLPNQEPGPTLRLLVVRTAQLDRLRDFYERLGIQFVAERHGNGPLHYAGDLGGVVLELYPLDEAASAESQPGRLGLSVPNLSATFEALVEVGAKVVTKPRPTEWGLRGVVRDPDGRAVELYSAGEGFGDGP